MNFEKYNIISVIIIIIFVIFLYFSVLSPNIIDRSEYVENKTYEKFENYAFTYEVTRYPSFVNVSSNMDETLVIGITNDPYNLGFGIIPQGGSGKRLISLENDEDVKAKIKIEYVGNITEIMEISNTNFVLMPNESVKIPVMIKTDPDTPIGNYTGEIDLIIIKPKYNSLEFLLWVM